MSTCTWDWIRLSADRDAPDRELSLFIGRFVDVFLNGKPVDRECLYSADEKAGLVEMLIPQEGFRGKTVWMLNAAGSGPLLTLSRGAVEIRLKDSAPPEVRHAYEALRRGAREEAQTILDQHHARLREEDEGRRTE